MMMGPPSKRRKTKQGLADAEEDGDELFLEPEELNQQRDPVFQLQKGRALAANRLKSRFEDIFAKYERDFTGVGDEIDLRTGEVVVDNGHLQSMMSAKDRGDEEEYDEDDEDEDSLREEERNAHEKESPERPTHSSSGTGQRNPWQVIEPGWPQHAMGEPSRLSPAMFANQQPFMNQYPAFYPSGLGVPMNVDPAWQAPVLPESAFLSNSFDATVLNSVTRKVIRKSITAPESPEAEEEDILMGTSQKAHNEEESPLIKQKFPTIESPNEDPDLKELIREVAEIIPETPPSMKTPKIKRPRGRPPSLKKLGQLAGANAGSEKKRPRGRPRLGGNKISEEKENVSNLADKAANLSLNQKQRQPQHNDLFSREYDDLKSYLDVTGLGTNKPAGQVLYVDIRASKLDGSHAQVREKNNFVLAGAKEIASKARNNGAAKFQEKKTEHVVIDDIATGSEDPGSTAKERVENTPKMPSNQLRIERNIVDPSFTFSDEDNLLPKNARKGKKRLSEPAKIATAETVAESSLSIQNSSSGGNSFERNAVDPSYAFSDEEYMPPRRAKRSTHNSESEVAAEVTTKTSCPAVSRVLLDMTATKQSPGSDVDKPEPRRRGRPKRSVSKPNLVNETRTQNETTHCISGNEAETNPKSRGVDAATLKSSRPQERKHKPVGRHSVQASQLTEAVEQAVPDLGSNKKSRPLTRSQGEDGSTTEQPMTAQAKEMTSNIQHDTLGPRSRQNNRYQPPTGSLGDPSPAATEPSMRAHTGTEQAPPKPSPLLAAVSPSKQQQQQQPSTPRAKSTVGDTASFSTRPGLISLLSDNEDEEDEISFALADFTPSGHHRILTDRSLPQFPTSATSSSSTAKKRVMMRADLFFGSASSRKMETPRNHTPDSANQKKKKKHRHRRNSSTATQLARSVVKARPESRLPSPVGSVIQTPGGTKRRCGEGGFRCELDFCFVCM